ncbi:hypothetical protein MMC08_002260 [Hypocenomyce scalaris]|nr:hypothetical protein [Hypocenomyce scalaris]
MAAARDSLLNDDATTQQLELLRRQYFQLWEPDKLTIPSMGIMRLSEVQASIFESMFREDNLKYTPPDRYKTRVLKKLVDLIERAVVDPEEDEISDDMMSFLTQLMMSPSVSEGIAAQQKAYVTYTAPSEALSAPQITLLEARSLLASSGTTGLRTWEAALYLGAYLFSSNGGDLVAGKNIVELGAGTGFVSILCAKHIGAKHVLATDGDGGVIDDLASNIYINGLDGSGLIDTAVLKWGHALTDEMFQCGEEPLNYNVVLGADVTYDKSSIPALVSTLRDIFDRYNGARAIISATIRNQQTLDSFVQACDHALASKTSDDPHEATVDMYKTGYWFAGDEPTHNSFRFSDLDGHDHEIFLVEDPEDSETIYDIFQGRLFAQFKRVARNFGPWYLTSAEGVQDLAKKRGCAGQICAVGQGYKYVRVKASDMAEMVSHAALNLYPDYSLIGIGLGRHKFDIYLARECDESEERELKKMGKHGGHHPKTKDEGRRRPPVAEAIMAVEDAIAVEIMAMEGIRNILEVEVMKVEDTMEVEGIMEPLEVDVMTVEDTVAVEGVAVEGIRNSLEVDVMKVEDTMAVEAVAVEGIRNNLEVEVMKVEDTMEVETVAVEGIMGPLEVDVMTVEDTVAGEGVAVEGIRDTLEVGIMKVEDKMAAAPTTPPSVADTIHTVNAGHWQRSKGPWAFGGVVDAGNANGAERPRARDGHGANGGPSGRRG